MVFLKKKINNFTPKTFLEIGGGFGILGEILKHSGIKGLRYINLDLPPLSLLSEIYLSKVYSKNEITNTKKLGNQNIKISNLKKITCLNSWQIEKLKGKIDLFINFISFQEMEPHIVKNYLKKIIALKPKYILLRNLREGKQIKKENKIGVKKATKKKDYINFLKNYYSLLSCDVEQFGYHTFDNYNSEVIIFKKIKK